MAAEQRIRLSKIISGGQTGVDQAALRAAIDSGLAHGGWCPPGRLCESGTIPSVFHLQETSQECSPLAPAIPRSQRTEWNVRDSDGLLVLRPEAIGPGDPGNNWAIQYARHLGKPVLVLDPDDQELPSKVKFWLQESKIRLLNVSGPSEMNVNGIEEKVYAVLFSLFQHIRFG